MNYRIVLILGMPLLLATQACGRSPLLHHLSAESLESPQHAAVPAPQDAGSAAECPLTFPQSGLCASAAWTGEPSTESEGELTLKFWSRQVGAAAGPYTDPGLDVAVKLWMPAMGHGSSPTQVTRTAAGVFDVQRIYFIMPGAWEVHVQLKRGGTLVEEAVFPVSL